MLRPNGQYIYLDLENTNTNQSNQTLKPACSIFTVATIGWDGRLDDSFGMCKSEAILTLKSAILDLSSGFAASLLFSSLKDHSPSQENIVTNIEVLSEQSGSMILAARSADPQVKSCFKQGLGNISGCVVFRGGLGHTWPSWSYKTP